jgi:hypothetical protein
MALSPISSVQRCNHFMKAIIIALVLAEALPIPKGQQQCPSGYVSEAHYCVPANPNTPIAVPKSPGQQCPSTMIQSGGHCIAK